MEIIAISRESVVAVTDTGETCPVSVWLDADGDETYDVISALAAVVDLPDGRFAAVDLRDYEPVTVQ